MDVKVFRYFVTLVRFKSYTRAARELYMTTQGLQSAIRRLESSIGVSLLNPQIGTIELTEYGIIFYRYAQSILHEHDSMMDEIVNLQNRERGRILLSVSTGLFNVFSRNNLDEFNVSSKTGATVEVMRTMLDYECENALLDKVCDFAFANDPIDHALFSSIPLHRDTMFLWVDATSPLAKHENLHCHDLEGLTITCLASNAFKTSRTIEDFLPELVSKCTIVHADEMIEVLELAMKTKSCALTVRTHVKTFEKEGYKGIPILDLDWGFSVAYRSDRILSPQDKEFLKFLKQRAAFFC